jgi:hypothetical protein
MRNILKGMIRVVATVAFVMTAVAGRAWGEEMFLLDRAARSKKKPENVTLTFKQSDGRDAASRAVIKLPTSDKVMEALYSGDNLLVATETKSRGKHEPRVYQFLVNEDGSTKRVARRRPSEEDLALFGRVAESRRPSRPATCNGPGCSPNTVPSVPVVGQPYYPPVVNPPSTGGNNIMCMTAGDVRCGPAGKPGEQWCCPKDPGCGSAKDVCGSGGGQPKPPVSPPQPPTGGDCPGAYANENTKKCSFNSTFTCCKPSESCSTIKVDDGTTIPFCSTSSNPPMGGGPGVGAPPLANPSPGLCYYDPTTGQKICPRRGF